MTRSIRGARRAAALLAGAAATALLASGCGAGQISATADMKPTISGVNAQTPDGLFKIRDLVVVYPNPAGYPAGGSAPLSVSIFNDSQAPVTVKVTTDSAGALVLANSAQAAATPSAGASASPSAGASSPSAAGSGSPAPNTSSSPSAPAAPAGAPATIEIPAAGFVILAPTATNVLQLVGLNAAVRPGESVNLVFDFNGQQIRTTAPVAIPLSPAPVATPVTSEEGAKSGEGSGHG